MILAPSERKYWPPSVDAGIGRGRSRASLLVLATLRRTGVAGPSRSTPCLTRRRPGRHSRIMSTHHLLQLAATLFDSRPRSAGELRVADIDPELLCCSRRGWHAYVVDAVID